MVYLQLLYLPVPPHGHWFWLWGLMLGLGSILSMPALPGILLPWSLFRVILIAV